jgi:hypothetical protein
MNRERGFIARSTMKRERAVLAGAIGVAALAFAALAAADAPDAGPPAAVPDPSAYAEPLEPTCAEHVPDGVKKPLLWEEFPKKGKSGYAVPLVVKLSHGKGETVLVDGARIARQGAAARALAAAGFALPESDGGAGPSVDVKVEGSKATTTLTIPVVPLATKAGRVQMQLPPLPVTLARANGELVTVCTKPHPIRIDEPIALEEDPKVRPNPPPRPQKEEWVFFEQLLIGVLVGLFVAGIVALFIRWWSKRPKPEAPKVRPIPWVVALEELEALRTSTLLAEHKNDDYFDRVSDTVRRYLGARYHFDDLGWSGLETTTDEMRALLRRVTPAVPMFGAISTFLDEADLVKFARVLPADADCVTALDRAIAIVRGTIPPNWAPNGAAPPAHQGEHGP